MNDTTPTVVDLFSGAGGLSLGVSRAGFLVLGAIDTDRQAIDAHMKNFGNTRHVSADIAGLSGGSLRDALELDDSELSGIVGGPPCQGFSSMGRRNENDGRNRLFVDFFRIVSELRPAFFLAENVPGIMHPANAPIRERAFSLVSNRYTILDPLKVTASDYGAPTVRTRMFFYGYLPDRVNPLTEDSFLPPADVTKVRVKDALDGLPTRVNPDWQLESEGWRVSRIRGEGEYFSRLHGHVPRGVGDPVALHRLKTECRSSGTLGTRHTIDVANRYASLEPGESDRVSRAQRLDPDGFCPTLRAGTGPDMGSYQAVRPIHPRMPRVITPREAARLQGFPDWFTFSPSKWQSFRQIGSSVSPIVAERLMSTIHASLIK